MTRIAIDAMGGDHAPFEIVAGGCLLLGVKGITVISHGRSKAYAIKNAVRVAKEAVETCVNKKISENIG